MNQVNKQIYVILIRNAIFLFLSKFSGQSDEPTDEDYDGNYDDDITSGSVELSPSNFSSEVSEGTTEQTVEKISEAITIPSTPTILFTVPTTKIMKTDKPIETTIGKINIYPQSVYGEHSDFLRITQCQKQSNFMFLFLFLRFIFLGSSQRKCPQKCHCLDDQVDCSHQNLLQIPKHLPFNTASLNLSHNNLVILNVSDLINCSQLRQLVLNDNKIGTIINAEVSCNNRI